ncbi:cytochrome c family protein [Anaplasma platys]|uniref:Cytochrome c homolog n=1 Tax=Anaplasma platys TaxID=949 RepID=A0A858PXG3_9RICK|nr:cytochrome c family protein [Anaplasma platys]QJC27286.1 cytochrome c family protein [Anaplasma platys]
MVPGGFNFNRVATSVLLASFIVLMVSNVVDLLYRPTHEETRGYTVDVPEEKTEGEAAAPDVVVDIVALLADANVERGQVVAKKCSACHTFNEGGPNRVGPNLWGIVGSPKAHMQGFSYSKAMLNKGGHWTEEELFKYLTNPKGFVVGTRMVFPGLPKPRDCADLVAYLKTLK